MQSKHSRFAGFIAVIFIFLAAAVCFSAYKGHEDDRDAEAVLKSYPRIAGTALDGCALCHKGGNVEIKADPGRVRYLNSCDYCHEVHLNQKKDASETLNPFGKDYLAAGRNADALKAIAALDSDGDGFSNQDELDHLTQPGLENSNPALNLAPRRTVTFQEMTEKIPVVEQIIFYEFNQVDVRRYLQRISGS